MPSMNKTAKQPVTNERAESLKKELMEETIPTSDLNTGTQHVQERSPWSSNVNEINQHFSIKQGRRRRNPTGVLLHQFPHTGAAVDTFTAQLEHETKRSQMPEEFTYNDSFSTGLVGQLGVNSLSAENFKQSKKAKNPKLSRVHLIGN
jgi:hypothetical protein